MWQAFRSTASGPMGYTGPGVRSDTVPATLSRLIINVNDRVDGDNRMMAVHAGLVAVAQNHDGALQPMRDRYRSRCLARTPAVTTFRQ